METLEPAIVGCSGLRGALSIYICPTTRLETAANRIIQREDMLPEVKAYAVFHRASSRLTNTVYQGTIKGMKEWIAVG